MLRHQDITPKEWEKAKKLAKASSPRAAKKLPKASSPRAAKKGERTMRHVQGRFSPF